MEENLKRLKEAKKQIDLVRESTDNWYLGIQCEILSDSLRVIMDEQEESI